ncbi:unnamed protein product [Albugo candida]|uniref:Solanesyl diphosphate synthase n=1 Tax=Albugo candida TaxID=65357 RepID=A0A024GB46_9STRA|nr:unnamed protein product [Albugo candida]|eukprot:CCI43552.1 unnamed protein product [Albugo candida]
MKRWAPNIRRTISSWRKNGLIKLTSPEAQVKRSFTVALQERAMRALKEKVIEDLEHNPNLWLSKSAVDTATVSILDPSPMYAHNHRQTDLVNDMLSSQFECPARKSRIDTIGTFETQEDPFVLVQEQLRFVTESIKQILGTDHPVLSTVAKYFFEQDGGKKVRPTMVLLISQAAESNRLSNDLPLPSSQSPEFTMAAQQRLAEITEMIHTASLLHDDVIDEAEMRRGIKSVNQVFGDKLSILAGDFLLARSSVCLARLRSLEVVELMSTIIEHLVKGEVMQMRNVEGRSNISLLEYYLRKNYYKTASLMANSCKAALTLGKHTEYVCEMGFAYGRHLGLAFQLIDDVLDYEGLESGKPLLADLKCGVITAPLLLAQEQFPELKVLSDRKFSRDGDIDQAFHLVSKSSGIQKTKELAIDQANLACDAILQFSASPARDALVRLAQCIVNRSK